MRSRHLFFSILFFSMINHAIASTDVKNLKDRINPVWYNKETLQTLIQKTAQEAGMNPYLLSFPLAGSAQLGDENAYNKLMPLIMAILDKMPTTQNSLRAWLYGRALFSANSIGDNARREVVRTKLENLLKDPITAQDRFSTWGWGYLASLDKKSYIEFKPALEKALKHLTADSQVANADKLWAWLMAAYDAAEANDFAFYQQSFQTIKDISHETTVVKALNKGLGKNDFPAWGLGLALLAAATLRDEGEYQELKGAFAISLQSAKELGSVGEEILAEVNGELALMRHN